MPMSQAQAGQATAYEPGSGVIYQVIPSGASLALAVLDTYIYIERYRVVLQDTVGWASLHHQILCMRGLGHILLRVEGGINRIYDVNNGHVVAEYAEDTALDEYDWRLGLRYGSRHMVVGFDVKAGSTGMVYGLFDPAAATFVTGQIPGVAMGGSPTYGISGSGSVSFYFNTSTIVQEATFDGDWTVRTCFTSASTITGIWLDPLTGYLVVVESTTIRYVNPRTGATIDSFSTGGVQYHIHSGAAATGLERYWPKTGFVMLTKSTADDGQVFLLNILEKTISLYAQDLSQIIPDFTTAIFDQNRRVWISGIYADGWTIHLLARAAPRLLDLDDVVTDTMSLAGFTAGDLTFEGFDPLQTWGFVIHNDTTIQNAMRTLADIYSFAWCDTGSGFVFKKAAAGDLLVADAAFTSTDIVERPQPVQSSDEADIRTPSSVEMEYVSKEGAYRPRPVSFNMTTGVLNSITTPRLSTPILLNDAEAQRICIEKFFDYQEKRRSHGLVVTPEHIALLPGDIVSFPSGTISYIARIEQVGVDLRNMGVEILARDYQTEVETEVTSTSNNPPQPTWTIPASQPASVGGQLISVSVGSVSVSVAAGGSVTVGVGGQSMAVSVGSVTVTVPGGDVTASVSGQSMTASVGTVTVSAGGGAAPLVFQGANATTSVATHTYTAAPVGTASADRLVIAAISAKRTSGAARTITSVTIGGIAATVHATIADTAGTAGSLTVGVASVIVPTGTTADVVVVYSGAPIITSISVYTVGGTGSVFSTVTANSNDPSTSTLDVNTGGFIVAAFVNTDTSADMSMTGVTEDRDVAVSTAGRVGSGSASGLASQTDRTIAVSSSAGFEALAAVSWSPGGGGDPNWTSVKLLLGFEGVDGSTTVTDESSTAKGNATISGNAQIDTAQFKFGASSLLLDGTGDYISYLDSPDWDLSDANADQFTLELWGRFNAITASNRGLLAQGNTIGTRAWKLELSSADTTNLTFEFTTDGSTAQTVVTSGAAITTATWYHLAVDKDSSGKIRIYVNGTMRGSGTPANSAIFNSTQPIVIGGGYGFLTPINGWIDEVRITKGIARYASDSGFTVPAAAFPRS